MEDKIAYLDSLIGKQVVLALPDAIPIVGTIVKGNFTDCEGHEVRVADEVELLRNIGFEILGVGYSIALTQYDYYSEGTYYGYLDTKDINYIKELKEEN